MRRVPFEWAHTLDQIDIPISGSPYCSNFWQIFGTKANHPLHQYQTKCHVTECLEKNSAEIKRMSLDDFILRQIDILHSFNATYRFK